MAADGRRFTARYVVCAVPPAVYNSIAFSPPLPPLKLRARGNAGNRKCGGLKTMTYYATAWWQRQGRVGSILSDECVS